MKILYTFYGYGEIFDLDTIEPGKTFKAQWINWGANVVLFPD